MRVNRFLAAAAALFIAVLPARADQILGPGRIDNSGRLMLPGGPKLGTYQGGKFTSQPDALQITGPGSTGDVSGMSVAPGSGAIARTLADRGKDFVRLEDYCSTTLLNTSAGDITSCLQNAVNAAQATGRVVSMPKTPAGVGYWSLSSTITMGNGSTSAASTLTGYGIEGAGSGGIYGTRGTYLAWTGAAGGTMLQVNGPIENVRVRGLNLNGLNVAARILNVRATRFGEFSDIAYNGFTGVGFGLYGILSPQSPATTHSNNIMLSLTKLYGVSNQPGAIAFDVDGVMFDGNGNSQSNDTWLSEVRNSRFEVFGQNSTAIRVAFSDNMLWSQTHAAARGTVALTGATTAGSTSITLSAAPSLISRGQVVTGAGIPSGTYITAISGSTLTLSQAATASAGSVTLTVLSTGLLFDASTSGTGGNSFPTGHLFLKSAIDNVGVIEDATHTIGVNNLIDFGTTDNEILPAHPKLRGTTDQGYSFGGYGGPTFTAYSPALTAGTPGATPPTFSNVALRYAISGRQLVLNGSFTVTTRGTANNILIPLPAGITSAGLQFVSFGNASTGSATYGVTQGGFLRMPLPGADGQIFTVSATVDF